jgi:hypothetical protein
MLYRVSQRFPHPVGQLAPPSDALALRRGFFGRRMTRQETIHANDQLRQRFTGGRIEVCHSLCDIDDRTMGQMLCAIAKFDKFSADSLHDKGALVFAGLGSPGTSNSSTTSASSACVWVKRKAISKTKSGAPILQAPLPIAALQPLTTVCRRSRAKTGLCNQNSQYVAPVGSSPSTGRSHRDANRQK